MNKSQKSMLNASTALLNMLVTSVVGLVLGKSILNNYGSEYNGINATASQIISTIMVLEGGFTLASNIALFAPLAKNDYNSVNGILSASKRKFFVIGSIAFAIGCLISFVYPLMVSSSMPYFEFVLLMFTILLPSCFNLGFNMKHRVLLLTEQKEYIISLFSTITYALGNIIAIAAIYWGVSLVIARVIIMISLFVNYIMIALYCRYKYPFINYNAQPMFEKIKGTKSVIALKLTSIAYSTLPIIAISAIPEQGALLASVYAVYKSVVSMIKNCLSSITNAPRLGFGALFAEGRTEEAKKKFVQYEMITCIGISVVLGTTCLLLMSFIDIYTRGVNDTNYHNNLLAIMMLLTVFFETLHIPSGQMIQMSGRFRASKNIQMIACAVLLVTLVTGSLLFGLYGAVASTLMAACFLAFAEIGYTRIKIFGLGLLSFLKNTVPCAIVCVIATIVGLSGELGVSNYIEFALAGTVSVVILGIITIAIYFVIDKTNMLGILKIMKTIVRRSH